MEARRLPPGWAAALVLAALILALLLALASEPSGDTSERPVEGDLSPRLAELATPSVRSAPPRRQAKVLSLAPGGPGSLQREGNRVVVEVRFDSRAAAGVEDLRAAGARVVGVNPRYQSVTVAARPDELTRLSGVPGVVSVTELLAPVINAVTEPGPVSAATSSCPHGVASEGDFQLGAVVAREAFGVDGGGITVGVLSDSYDRNSAAATSAAGDVASGDLPGPGNPCGRAQGVRILDDSLEEGTDEGRAMAQIVHDLAPGARLAFATAFGSDLAFANNIRGLAAPVAAGGAGADVIVDDVSYFSEPFFQEGPIAVAVAEVSAAGVSYFSSAGNNNLVSAGKNIASWEAPAFRLATTCPAALFQTLPHVSQCMDFDPSLASSDPTFGVTVGPEAGLRLDMQWAEPWNGVGTDLDVHLLDSDGEPIVTGGSVVGSELANVANTQQPFEFLAWKNESGSAREVQLVVNRYTGEGGGDSDSPRLKLALVLNGSGVSSVEYPESSEGDVVGPTIFGHNGAANAVSVGAIPYDRSDSPEEFSSAGPVTHYFGPVVGTASAKPLAAPLVLAKPDLVATDRGANTFFGECLPHTWRFFGTSAAAPHAAAAAALARQAAPNASPEDVSRALLGTARRVGAFPPELSGHGLLDTPAAIAELRSESSPARGGAAMPTAPRNCNP